MSMDAGRQLFYRIEKHFTEPRLLEKLDLTKPECRRLLRGPVFRDGLAELADNPSFTCRGLLEFSREVMRELSPEPVMGWLTYLVADRKHALYPDNFPDIHHERYERGSVFFLELMHLCTKYEEEKLGFSPTLHFKLATEEEYANSSTRAEYLRFLAFCRETWLLEYMRLAAETTPFNTLGHIAGVHHVAMHMARQLRLAHVSVDLALMSAAALSHDIGKFGCKEREARRVPYLHYYYTDQCLQRNGMPVISYIAANHSTWDLELENLSLESLLLIYADFRVKSTRENGKEIIHFYSLQESFDVILGKLDNVDDAKRKRYEKVYSKLVDFEGFMKRKGVHTDFSDTVPGQEVKKDSALLSGPEIIRGYKDAAVSHNIVLMHILNDETAFSNILETARSEKDWKNTRTYLNILREYSTYINQRQKLVTINFLYELLMHREGDIRSSAAELMGRIITGYDIEYRKEIPEGMKAFSQLSSSCELLETSIDRILSPDHKLTDQHRKWLGYKLETLFESVLDSAKPSRKASYLAVIEKAYRNTKRDDFAAFVMVIAMEKIPFEECTEDMKKTFVDFALAFGNRREMKLAVSLWKLAAVLLERYPDSVIVREAARRLLDRFPDTRVICVQYLKRKIAGLLELPNREDYRMEGDVDELLNKAFLENLKTATPWISKLVNIEFIHELTMNGKNRQPVHTTTHLANLLTGAECNDVRHLAGNDLAESAHVISHEQCNEVAIELLKGLELGENEFSKNIPLYLGRLILHLNPEEVDEILLSLENMLTGLGDPIVCVTLETIGILIQFYPEYRRKHRDEEENHNQRMRRLAGFLLRGLSHDHQTVSQEAFYVIGEYIFASERLTLQEKYRIYRYIAKKALHILQNKSEDRLDFLINAAALNHFYRFISDYTQECGEIGFDESEKVAFFPGTFDPFSLSHKGIVQEIRHLGFEVYLAIDEFSWSKKVQPKLIRRKIAAMSTADDPGVFMFPDEIPVNIGNPSDLAVLAELFAGRKLYIVEGSDVTMHASAYQKDPEPNSIHGFNHIIFRRHSDETVPEGPEPKEDASGRITGEVIRLTLPVQLEDISSTRIRENIDLNRDISHLIDPMVQKYIYENSLYLREPQYKPLLYTRSISCDLRNKPDEALWQELRESIFTGMEQRDEVIRILAAENLSLVLLRDEEKGGIPIAVAAARPIDNAGLYREFGDLNTVRHIRDQVGGRLLLLKALYVTKSNDFQNYYQLVLTELLAIALAKEYTFCLYHGVPELVLRSAAVEASLMRQGFVKLTETAAGSVMAVDMHEPYVLTKNIDTVIKEPFNVNPDIRKVLEEAHRRLQTAITRLAPGNLVISFDASIMHHRLVQKITEINHVPNRPTKPRKLGEKMCVPFGKFLRGSIAPNTVTKTLHTEKVFSSDMKTHHIAEFPQYSPIPTQLRTIRSFGREVILVDDLFHNGDRVRQIAPMIAESGVKVYEMLLGIMSADGRDLAETYGIRADSVYFVPNIAAWFVESSLYPFIGGDSVHTAARRDSGLLNSINMILPYVAPGFLAQDTLEAVYQMSMTCLENARDIMTALEREYQKTFERNLTLDRLSEAILNPTCPDKGMFMRYSMNMPASVYIENDIKQLRRMEKLVTLAQDAGGEKS